MTETLSIDEADGVLTATLNRPAKLNAINHEMIEGLWEVTRRLGDDDSVRVLVITGAGRYASAGLDMSKEASEERRLREGPTTNRIGARRRYRLRHHTLQDELESIEKPIIFAAQGPCLGLGLEIAACCDFRFCVPEAHFALPEVRLGVLPASGGISRITRLVGPHWSKWMGMACQEVDAELARRIGLIHDIYPAEVFAARVHAFARSLAELPEEAVGLAKLTIDMTVPYDREKTRNVERIATSALYGAKARPER